MLRARCFIPDAQDSCSLRVHRLRGNKNPLGKESPRIAYLQRNITINPATGKPAGVCNFLMLHPHRDHIFTRPHKGRYVIAEGGISIGPLSQVIAVYPHPCVLVYPPKANAHPLSCHTIRQNKMFPVPGRSSRQIPCATGVAFVKGISHGPVMGQRYFRPGPVVMAHVVRAGFISQVKPPVAIQALYLAHRILHS